MCINCCDLTSFAPFFEFLDICTCVTLKSISQRQQLLCMLQDPVDVDDLFDSPAKPLDLKKCSVFVLLAVDTTNLSKGWRCCHCRGAWAKRNQTKVTAHLAKIGGESITLCDFNLTMPSGAERAAHDAFRGSLLIAGRNSRTFRAKVIDNHLSDWHDALVCADDMRKGTSDVRPQANLFNEDDEMPGLDPRSCSVPKPSYARRSSPMESVTSFTTSSTSGKKRNIAALSEGWLAFQRGGLCSTCR